MAMWKKNTCDYVYIFVEPTYGSMMLAVTMMA